MMATFSDAISDTEQAFIEAQQMFFVGSAPLSPDGHVNLSPKGLDSLRVLSPNRVAYLDLTGSGNETSAHLRENGRITLMFCAFAGPPKILRLYGRGDAVLPGAPQWDELRALFGAYPAARQIIDIQINRVQTSCGFAVPRYEYVGQRDTLIRWANAKGAAGIETYRAERNVRSIDGLLTPLGESLDR
jgi:hypothetical protein